MLVSGGTFYTWKSPIGATRLVPLFVKENATTVLAGRNITYLMVFVSSQQKVNAKRAAAWFMLSN